MTALQRIRQEQEELATHPGPGSLDDAGFKVLHRRWLKLQRTVLAIRRGERCEEHAFEDCHICRPQRARLRDDVGPVLTTDETPEEIGNFPRVSKGALWI